MFQTNMLETGSEPLEGPAQRGRADAGIGGILSLALAFLRRQYLIVIVSAALGMSAGAAYLRITPPNYTAQAQVLLAPPPQFIQQQSLAAPAFDVSQIETQLQIIKSRAIAVAVIKQLKLEDDPDFKSSGRSLLSSLWRWIRSWVSPQPNEQQAKDGQPPQSLIQAFQERLSANRIEYSNVIEIGFNSSSAARAAEIANATANAYIADQVTAKSEANRLATDWLQQRLNDLGEQASQAERAVGVYKSQNNIVTSGGKPIEEQNVADLNNRLIAARAQTSEALVRLNRYESILSINSSDASSMGTLDAAGSGSDSNSIINSLRQKYLEMARRESEWASRFGQDHRAVIDLRSRMRELRTSILDEVRRLAESARGDLEVSKQRQEAIEKQLAEAISQSRSTNSAEITIRGLENQAKTLRSMYETFLQRYTGSLQQETFPITETRVLSPASPLQLKSKPKSGKVMAFAILGGLALGIALGLLREVMDRVFRTAAQIEGTLELPCLSLVPLLSDVKPAEKTPPPPQAEEDSRPRVISAEPKIDHYIAEVPMSRFSEAIRSIKLAIDLSPNKAANQIIGITSALPNEGKTTIAASLAHLIGHSGKKVILLDCDLRNPSLSASLAPNAATGVIEIIDGSRSIQETIWRDPKTSLAFLPAVRQRPLMHSSEILSAEGMRKLLEQLRINYDYIIVDLPPLVPLIDIRATSTLIDCFILVIEWGRTKTGIIQHALHTAPKVYKSMIGAVLNKTDFKAMGRYDINWSDYHNDKYYALYGISDSAERLPKL